MATYEPVLKMKAAVKLIVDLSGEQIPNASLPDCEKFFTMQLHTESFVSAQQEIEIQFYNGSQFLDSVIAFITEVQAHEQGCTLFLDISKVSRSSRDKIHQLLLKQAELSLTQNAEKKPEQAQSILIIEDEPEIIEMLKRVLHSLNFNVSEAHDGEQGLTMALEGGYDLVVVDGLLPKLDGRKVVKLLREKDQVTPILVMSAVFRTNQVRQSFKDSGADRFLPKPFKIKEFITIVNELLSQ